MKTFVTLKEAFILFEEEIKQKEETCLCPVEFGLGHRLAEDIYAPFPQPPFSKSAMDGFVFRKEDIGCVEPFLIQGALYAGDNATQLIEQKQCFKIMTGAKIPDNGAVVVQQEHCVVEENKVTVNVWPKRINICLKGEDFTVLDYITLALLSSIGRTKIQIYKKPRIAVLVSGNEVWEPGRPLPEGKIYDSNAMLIKQRLLTLGYGAKTIKFLPDDPKEVATTLEEMSRCHDIIITTGGVSVDQMIQKKWRLHWKK